MSIDWYREGVEGIYRLLDAGADVCVRGRDGTTCLFPPAAVGDVHLLKTLIAKGADVNAHNHAGGTPMLAAAREGQVAVVRALLESGAKSVVRDDNGTTPLHLAAELGNVELVDELLGEPVDSGLDLDEMPRREPYCRLKLNGELVNLNMRDGEGRTPMHCVAECESDLNDPSGDSASALVGDGMRGPAPEWVVARLLVAGAEPNVQNNEGATPLHLAAACGWAETVRALLGELGGDGGDPNKVDREGMTPLHRLVQIPPDVDPGLRTFKALIESGADPNAPNDQGRTPLHLAAASEYADENGGAFVKALLEAGADPNVRDKDGRTPLHEAVDALGGDACVEALTAAGADPTIKDKDGATPFQHHLPPLKRQRSS